jgi:predicted rRNA methylase YqxC with S4 and FtsJ domains
MTATDILKHEHQIILLVLNGVQREAERIQEAGAVRADKVAEMVDEKYHQWAHDLAG